MYLTRAQWGATTDISRVPLITTPVSLLYVHHNVIEPTASPQADMERTEQADIVRFGKPSYDYGIHPSGIILEGMTTHLSADTYGHNRDSLSIMFMGNFEVDEPTPEAMIAGRVLVQSLLYFGLVIPGFNLYGHRDTYATACPGANLYPRLSELLVPFSEDDDMIDPAKFDLVAFAVENTQKAVGRVELGLYELSHKPGADPAAIAKQLAPLLASSGAAMHLTDADLQAIAKTVADEEARRLAT